MPVSLPVAAAVSAAVAATAWRVRALTAPGMVAAWAVGLAVLTGTGWAGGGVLLAFFVSSSLVGRVAGAARPPTGDGKGETRDPWQVLANGGAAGAGALLGLRDPLEGLWVLTVALAAAGADTWATSLGAWSPTPPRDILGGRVVPPGTNGGITVHGTAGAAAGALLIAGIGGLAAGAAPLTAAGALLGFGGMLVDSALGSAVQGRFRCPACGTATERRRHRCGTVTVCTGGWAWLTNDGVNALATCWAAGAGWLAWRWWG